MKYIVVDIDGTIAQIHPERLKLIQGKNKDWDAFYKACHMDTPIQNVIDMIEIMVCDSYCEWVFVTGRSEICRQETFDWLNKHMAYYASDSDICMRKEGDFIFASSILDANNLRFLAPSSMFFSPPSLISIRP